MKIRIGMASLADIIEKACGVYRKELAETEYMYDVSYLFESLADVMKLWDAINGFDCDDELIVTLERREVKDDGSDNRN